MCISRVELFSRAPDALITLGIHSALMNTDGDATTVVSFPSFVVSCKGLLRNAIEQQKGLLSIFDEDLLKKVYISVNVDTTFGLTREGWCHGSLQARGNRRVRKKMTGEGFPICYLLARTETGVGVASMFVDTRDFLRKFENGFQFYWNMHGYYRSSRRR